MNLEKVALAILFVSSFFIFWLASGGNSSDKIVLIERVLDGDTLQMSGGGKIRLLGLNTPESGMFFYEEAKNFTKSLTENQNLVLESSELDKYGRELGYVFLRKELVNEVIIENGFAHMYYYGMDKYYDRLALAEKKSKRKTTWDLETFGKLWLY